jgi:XTP/dITP diphosphohydrolase
VATGNAHKLSEIEAILGPEMDCRFVALGDLGDFPDPDENGDTFYDNALIKAQAALDETGLSMAVADDSGLCVDALGGDPGIHSARWAGEHGNDAANNEKLLAELADVPDEARTARFHSTVVLVSRDEDGEEILAGNGDCEGTIARDLRGTNGFGYDPLFELADLPGRRMAELEPEEKNAISHRRRALDDLVTKLG